MLFIASSSSPLVKADKDAAPYPLINPNCFVESDKMAGITSGEFESDRDHLIGSITTDYRITGFQVCTTQPNYKGFLTAFRLVTAADFGDAVGYKDGIPIGPGVSNCSRFDL